MKTLMVCMSLFTLVVISGCWMTHESGQGGVAPVNEEFSIAVPSSCTVKQGETTTIIVTLNRGDYFKRDVQLNLKANGIGITPSYVLVKASDSPETKIQVSAAKNAALGEYIVSATGTPTSGRTASTSFTVMVVNK